MKLSALQTARYQYAPKLPAVLTAKLDTIAIETGKPTQSIANQTELKALFKNTYGKPLVTFVKGKNKDVSKVLRVGVILSGGQAPGGHNVIAGLFDGIKKGNKNSKLFGFQGGPSGLIDGKYVEIKDKFMDEYRNTGGFDIIGSGRTKIETPEQYAASMNTAKKMKLDAVVIIGGDDSNTNAALLAEKFLGAGMSTQVIGVPKTIDGDLKNEMIETSFGFDTACKTYSEVIGNIERDANSAKKYWHFVKLMGRSASHIGLECALQTQPNVCLISEEIEEKKMTLRQITEIHREHRRQARRKRRELRRRPHPRGTRRVRPRNESPHRRAQRPHGQEGRRVRQALRFRRSGRMAREEPHQGFSRHLHDPPRRHRRPAPDGTRSPRQRAGFAHRDREAPLQPRRS